MILNCQNQFVILNEPLILQTNCAIFDDRILPYDNIIARIPISIQQQMANRHLLEIGKQFADFLCDQTSLLDNYVKNAIRKLGDFQYPTTSYAKAWNIIKTEFSKRLEICLEKDQIVLVSDLINWIMPSLCCGYNDIVVHCLKSRDKLSNQNQMKQLLQIIEEFQLSSNLKDKDITLMSVYKFPLLILENFLAKIIQFQQSVVATIQIYEQLYSSENGVNEKERLRKQMSILRIEKKNIEQSLLLLNKHHELLSSEKETVNRDNSVIQYNIIKKQYSDVDKNNKYLVKFGCRLKFIIKLKQRTAKAEKRLKDRKLYILQLIDGEQKYIRGLEEYISYIKKPIEELKLPKIVTDEECNHLFSSIQQICNFHKQLFEKMKLMYDSYSKNQSYGAQFKKYIPFFKLYTDYILNAQSAQKLLQNLAKKHPQVDEICKRYMQEKEKVAYNELLQPTFKIARYEMLLQDIIKKTNPIMRDFDELNKAQELFKQNLTQVNDEVDKICRRNRLNQLEQEFGTPEKPIYLEIREFLAEFSLVLIREPKPEPVFLYIFSDLLLIVEETSRKIHKRIVVNQKFFPRRQEDNKTYRNMVTIHSDGYMTFTAGNDEKFLNKVNQVYNVLRKITKQSGELVIVDVIGTEEIGSTSFAKHTEYIIEVKYLELKKLLHLRFSELSEIIWVMQKHYKNNLNINQEDELKKNWFNNHKSKTIEDRKRVIRQIFQKLLNNELVKKEPAFLLQYIGLPTNFFEIARYSFEKRISINDNPTVSGIKRAYLTKKQEKQAFTILCGTEIKLGRDLFHDNDQSIKKKKDDAPKIQIKITTLDQDEPILIKVTDYDTVEDVCNKVSKLIGLRSNRDFRLFHQIGKKQLRVLEHEQKITKLFKFPSSQQIPIVSIFEKITSSVTKILSPETFPTLIFKKYYYLPFQIQHNQVRKDLTRLRLFVYQIFSEIKQMKYQLTFDEYLLFIAMLIFIEAEGQVNPEQIDPNEIHRIVPQTVFKLKNYSEEEWLERCQPHIKRLGVQIQKIIDYNKQQLKSHRIKTDSASKTSLYFGPKHLCSQIVLNKIKSSPIFGSNIFYVQPHGSCYEKLDKKGLKIAYNMWLAVKVGSLNLLTPSSKESILEIHYKDIAKIEVFSQSIVLKMDDYINEQYRLNTYQSFEISQLVKYNKALNEILLNLSNDSVLNSRVKEYREQLINYRITYEEEGINMISLIR